MSTYAVGDLQGCADELDQLLELVAFSVTRDKLWLVGDLVNRGPDSLRVLRRVRGLGDAAVAVLGNHDFHLLAVAAGHQNKNKRDTLDQVLAAPDRSELLDWLIKRPLLVQEQDYLMVHAGVVPQWNAAKAGSLAREVEVALRDRDRQDEFLRHLYGDEPKRWDESLTGWKRLRVIVNVFTRLRFCKGDGTMDFSEKRGPDRMPPGFLPWFSHPNRLSQETKIVCGHWSALGLQLLPNMMMLDSGCVWGGALTAMRLEDRRIFQVPSQSPISLM